MIKLAVASLSFDGFVDTGFVNTYALAKKVGYEYIEFNNWFIPWLTPSGIAKMKDKCEKARIVPAVFHSVGIGAVSTKDLVKEIGYRLRCIDATLELGCSRLSFTADSKNDVPSLKPIIEILNEIAPYAEEKSVMISLENHRDSAFETIDDYEEIFNSVSSKSISACIDTGHFEASGIEVLDVVERLFYRTSHIHLKDNMTFGDQSFSCFGDGTVKHDEFLKEIVKRDYDGYLTVELSPTSIPNITEEKRIDELKKPIEMFSKYCK